jgi:hypothetical protein
MQKFRVAALLLGIAGLEVFAATGKGQSPTDAGASASVGAQSAASSTLASASNSTSAPSVARQPQLELTYHRPTEKIKIRNYLLDTFGPFPVAAAVIMGGVDQGYKTPPEWGQGAEAYGKRVGSYFGIAAVTTTARYGLAEALREDTLYYRCECKGFFRRLDHALISTVTARRGEDGHRTLSLAALAAPYAGTMTGVYAWYPHRFDYKDGFRMGNYDLLAFGGVNIAREFIYGGPHTLFGSWPKKRSGSSGTGE